MLRYLLEFCSTVAEAARGLRRLPVPMAYNLLLPDRAGHYVTAYTRPDGPTILRRIPASTSHQDRISWARQAAATATLERERRLFELLGDRQMDEAGFIDGFLRLPLLQTGYHKGYGTLSTAVYRPVRAEVEYRLARTTSEAGPRKLDGPGDPRRVARFPLAPSPALRPKPVPLRSAAQSL